MANIISIHSFRGGTGKSNMTANITALLAAAGKRVGVVDTDIQSPGIHVILGLDQMQSGYTLNDFLWGNCTIEQTAHDVTANLGQSVPGAAYLIPSSIQADAIARILNDGFSVRKLVDGLHQIIDTLVLDVLLIDTHPGMNKETLLSIAISDTLVLILRPDQQDYLGTHVTLEVARRLDLQRLLLVVNRVPEFYDFDAVQQRVETEYQCPVGAVLPHTDEMMALESQRIFALTYPDHPLSTRLRQLVAALSPGE
jgi:MinD-like ATPase involved in chromosome partitioning or flagellar assembly